MTAVILSADERGRCIGCMACEKWCPDDYDAIRMLPFTQVIKEREATREMDAAIKRRVGRG